MKSNRLYLAIVIAWASLVLTAAVPLKDSVTDEWNRSPILGTLAALCAFCVLYFWLNGTKDVVYALCYHYVPSMRPKLPKPYRGKTGYSVALLYCCCDDFDGESLRKSMEQDYRCQTYILDDSSSEASKKEVDAFAQEHGCEVVRRKNREGFKAGNLNNFLTQDHAWEFAAIIDSDEILAGNFVSRSLDYFFDPAHKSLGARTGITQANHVATRNRTPFMELFSPGVDSHWPAYQSLKDRYGFLSLLGHGAMVSRECYEAAGGFPEVVAEDLCFSLRARQKGYFTRFMPDVTCEEEYPVDYRAFRKRHGKWTEGNMELIKGFTKEIFFSDLTWFEKLDILLFTYSLPLSAAFFGYLFLNVAVFPALRSPLSYPSWMLVPTVVFLLAPMLNDAIRYSRWEWHKSLAYFAGTMCLYGSLFYQSLKSSLKSLAGASHFHVTPKKAGSNDWPSAIYGSTGEIGLATGLAATTLILSHSILPCILIIATGLSAPFLHKLGK